MPFLFPVTRKPLVVAWQQAGASSILVPTERPSLVPSHPTRTATCCKPVCVEPCSRPCFAAYAMPVHWVGNILEAAPSSSTETRSRPCSPKTGKKKGSRGWTIPDGFLPPASPPPAIRRSGNQHGGFGSQDSRHVPIRRKSLVESSLCQAGCWHWSLG